jgi:arylformamidase
MNFEIIDISRELKNGIVVWPGSKLFELKEIASFERGNKYCESELSMNMHTGTHVDAPAHFLRNGCKLGAVALDKFIGAVQVIEFLENKPIDLEFIKKCKIEKNKIIFKTLNSMNTSSVFNESFVAITSEVAQYLVEKKIGLVGIDGHSIQLFSDSNPKTHEILLENGVIVLEGLDLSNVLPGVYKLIALPLKLNQAEGAPVRAVLIKGTIE